MNRSQAECSRILKLARIENDKGNGDGIGEETDTLEAAVASEGWAVVQDLDPEGTILCRKADGSHAVVMDMHGPWAVDVTL